MQNEHSACREEGGINSPPLLMRSWARWILAQHIFFLGQTKSGPALYLTGQTRSGPYQLSGPSPAKIESGPALYLTGQTRSGPYQLSGPSPAQIFGPAQPELFLYIIYYIICVYICIYI